MKWTRENDYLIRIPRQDQMLIDALVFIKEGIKIEESALSQLKDAAGIPTAEHALGMPDIHHGFGVPIGSVLATREVIVPAAVGYDINCGMRLLLTSLHEDEVDVRALANDIHREVPLGEGKKNVSLRREDFEAVLEGGLAALSQLRPSGHRVWDAFDPESEKNNLELVEDRGSMEGSAAALPARAIDRGESQLATLGGGNHFIELQRVSRIDDAEAAERLGVFKGQLALMIHSGSRGLGHEAGGHYMKLAREHCAKHGGVTNPDLCYLPVGGKTGRDYMLAMQAAANYAFINRALMAALARSVIMRHHPEARTWLVYDVTHNMAKLESHGGKSLWVHRKGSTRAFDREHMKGTTFADLGQPVLIPGSMGTASYLLVGEKTGAKSLFSVNHGAGRAMSRTAASGGRKGRGKRREGAVSDEEFKKSMEGIHLVCEDRHAVKEEAPAAYKDIDRVIETVGDAGLARVVARMIPRAVLKG